ncbi:MAG: hypothetical protein HOP15_15635 [Planctomycetes bacterium]|nr:hypothetical protein [Planctomycetota bacterium]
MARRPTEGAPGDQELESLCADAKRVSEACELLGFEFRGARHLIGLLEGASRKGVALSSLVEDPTNRPYIWDLEEE